MSNKIKSEQLGISFGTANSRLRKSIMFELVKRCGLDVCYQCGEKIDNIDELSIEHKIPWLHSDDPEKLFFDMNNIAFSHLKCNVDGARKLTRKIMIGNSGYIGVNYDDSKVKKYRARITVNSKTEFIGRYDTAKEAAIEVDKALIKNFGLDTATNKSLGLI